MAIVTRINGESVFQRVFLVAHSQYRYLFIDIARELRAKHGSEIFLYCSTGQEARFWEGEGDPGLFSAISVVDHLYRAARNPVADRELVIRKAREHEEILGATINTLAVADRHLGRGYALGGFRHPRSRISEGVSYEQMLNGYSTLVDFWIEEFRRHRPTMVLNGGKVPALLCRRYGVTFRTLAGSRFRNFHQWAHNEFFENPLIAPAFDRSEKRGSIDIETPYYAHMTLRQRFLRRTKLGRVIFESLRFVAQNIYWSLRGYQKAKGYYLAERVSYLWRRRADILRYRRLSRPLASLEGQPFVYYPLHTEPETALQTLSPEYFYQLAFIAALSRDLPAGVKLGVKETFESVGRRPRDFYQQIAEFKNVVILDMMELGLDVGRKAELVATITGTGGFEAATMGKPVVTYGQHNQYSLLAHVEVIDDESKLKSILERFVEGNYDRESAASDGARFLDAVLSVSFDLRDYDYIDLKKYDPVVVGEALKSLEASVAVTVP